VSFFKTWKARFSLREERVKKRRSGRTPKERGKEKVTPETKREKHPHHHHKRDYHRGLQRSGPQEQPTSAQSNTEKTCTSLLAKQLAGVVTKVEVPQDDAFKKGGTMTPPSSAHPQRGRPGLHLANQGAWRPRQCPQKGESRKEHNQCRPSRARQGFRPGLESQST
jgi:hypothetical protein